MSRGIVTEYRNHTASRKWNRFFGVPSDSNPNADPYTVSVFQYQREGKMFFANWACGCPRWTRNASRPECKHIKRVKHELDFGYIAYSENLPASVERFIKKYENAFEAVEVAEPSEPARKTRKPGQEESPASLIELY
jgi:hypothetical protein